MVNGVNGINGIIYGDGNYTAVEKKRLMDLGFIDQNGAAQIDFELLSESAQKELAANYQEFELSDDLDASHFTGVTKQKVLEDKAGDKNIFLSTLQKNNISVTPTVVDTSNTSASTSNSNATSNSGTTATGSTGTTTTVKPPVEGSIYGVSPNDGDKYTAALSKLAQKITSLKAGDDVSSVVKELSKLDASAKAQLEGYMTTSGLSTETFDEIQAQLKQSNPIETPSQTADNIIKWINSPGEYNSPYFKDNLANSLEHLDLTYADKQAILASVTEKLKAEGKDITNFKKISEVLNSVDNKKVNPAVEGSIGGEAPSGDDAYQSKLKYIADELNKLRPGDDASSILAKYGDLDQTAIANIKEYLKDHNGSINANSVLDQLTTSKTIEEPSVTATKIINSAKKADTTDLEAYFKSDAFKNLTYGDKQAILKELKNKGFDVNSNTIAKEAFNAKSTVKATEEQLTGWTNNALLSSRWYSTESIIKKAEALASISNLSKEDKAKIAEKAGILFDGTTYYVKEEPLWFVDDDSDAFFGIKESNTDKKRKIAEALNKN